MQCNERVLMKMMIREKEGGERIYWEGGRARKREEERVGGEGEER